MSYSMVVGYAKLVTKVIMTETQSSSVLTFSELGLHLKNEGYLTNTRKSILIIKILNS